MKRTQRNRFGLICDRRLKHDIVFIGGVPRRGWLSALLIMRNSEWYFLRRRDGTLSDATRWLLLTPELFRAGGVDLFRGTSPMKEVAS